jgi:hypothetical protein
MKGIVFILLAGVLGFPNCSPKKPFKVETVAGNPDFIPNTIFVGYEDISSPKFKALKIKYQIDTIFHGETDEFKRILLLRHWIRHIISIDNYGPYPGNGSAESILDEAIKGHGFHCGHYATVMNAVLNAYGYVTRSILADVGFPVDFLAGEGHHALNEVWSNHFHKWFISDAKYDYHLEKNSIPLSALEVRDEYLRNQGKDIVLVQGPDRIRKDVFSELKNRTTPLFARIFTWISWGKYNKIYTDWPAVNADYRFVYEDEYFKTHTWLFNGRPHWAYNTPYMIREPNRQAIEWTPNTIHSIVGIKDNLASIKLESNTPNFKTYQIKTGDNPRWKDMPDSISVPLLSDTNRFIFRTVNKENVTGPEHKINISRY